MIEEAKKTISEEEERAICEEAHKNVNRWKMAFSDNISNFKDSLQFALGGQWAAGDEQVLRELQQVPLTANKIYPMMREIVGEHIQSTPDIRVFSTSGESDPNIVKFYQDLFNTISYSSDAKTVWKIGFICALLGGWGVVKVNHGYVGTDTLEQAMFLEEFEDATRAFFDPSAKKKSKWDGEFAGEEIDISEAEFKRMYPNMDIMNNTVTEFSQEKRVNVQSGRVTLLIYQRKEWEKKKFVQTESGKLYEEEAYEELVSQYLKNQLEMVSRAYPDIDLSFIKKQIKKLKLPPHLKFVKTISRATYKIRTYKIYNKKILEHSDWISKYFGYVFLDCDSHWWDGKQVTRPFIVDAKDVQRFLNTLITKLQYLVKTMRNETWLAHADHIKGHEKAWRNVDNVTGALLYSSPSNPNVPPRPEQIPPTPINPSLFQAAEKAEEDIYTCLGLHRAFRGQSDSRYMSDNAMKREINQGNKTTLVVFDGLYECMTQVGKVVLDAAPKVYDTNRKINLFTRDGEMRQAEINAVDYEGNKTLDLTAGKYDIAVEAGISFELQREQIFRTLSQMISASNDPRVPPLILDEMAKNLPMPGANVIARRLQTLVPPDALAAGEGKRPPPKPPEPPNPIVILEAEKIQVQKDMLEDKRVARQEEHDIRMKNLELQMLKLQKDFEKALMSMHTQTLKASTELDKALMEHDESATGHAIKHQDQILKRLDAMAKLGLTI